MASAPKSPKERRPRAWINRAGAEGGSNDDNVEYKRLAHRLQ
jgi:hypothetical protein